MERPRKIGFAIKMLSNLLKRRIDISVSRVATDGITGMQCMVIGFIYRNSEKKDVFQKDIENEFNIRRSTATGILQLMVKNGLITRESVSHDARLKKLVLTEKALGIHRNIDAAITQMEDRISSGLTDEEIEVFFRIIDKISKNIE